MRHRGYMRSLLLQMMEDMRKRQLPFCFLMPAAEAIYTPFQFAFIYDQPVWNLKEDIKLKHTSIEETVPAGNMMGMGRGGQTGAADTTDTDGGRTGCSNGWNSAMRYLRSVIPIM